VGEGTDNNALQLTSLRWQGGATSQLNAVFGRPSEQGGKAR
jgi:hypothetical protein